MKAFDLSGKVALVTGARSGIGQAMALALAEAGADIVGIGSSPMPQTEAQVRALGRKFSALSVDLSDAFDATQLVEQVIAEFGRLDILVNNAGIIRRHNLADYPAADWDSVMTVNVRAPFLLSQAAAAVMTQGGRIIMTASILSEQGGIRVPAYTSSKHAIVGLTKALANELAPRGITVNAIAPGYIETDNTTALRQDSDRYRQIVDRIPVGRWGQPDDLATATLFLAAPGSGYVTGSGCDGRWGLARPVTTLVTPLLAFKLSYLPSDALQLD